MTALPARPGSIPPTDQVRPGTLRIDSVTSGNGVVVRVAGEVDMETAPILSEHLAAAVAQAPTAKPVVLDLRAVPFLSSNGLSVLMSTHTRCAAQNTPLHIVANHRPVLRPIQATGLTQILTIHPTVEAAQRTQ
jgi:anti-anti-sigma factor